MGITVGKPDIKADATAHVRGVRRGNHQGAAKHQPGHLAGDRSTARRSTGINSDLRDPIQPDMPNLSPA
ncbi:hypothetical protein GCM10023347_10870 [Streptomyces chumphonensis]|uniref:Uncharacterized protein n=1 Tax=Streptomyces chumphonensis TaxID=1214925 RepID=A0A927F138_9ACTN|nr:hypothetical protein [Streptomyces chumphonensis]MBD3933498.1 hypothetical protein [Streptomyces chumphonensis]